jgi:hypothetical protein
MSLRKKKGNEHDPDGWTIPFADHIEKKPKRRRPPPPLRSFSFLVLPGVSSFKKGQGHDSRRGLGFLIRVNPRKSVAKKF